MKKLISVVLICLCAVCLFSQENFQGFTKPSDFSEAVLAYDKSVSGMLSPLSNQLVKIFLGDKNDLSKRLDIFALAQLDSKELRILRNMIYAQYGLRFNSADLNDYFKNFPWYKPSSGNVDSKLTAVDKQNIELIQAFESRNENARTVNWGNAVGIWQDYFMMASGWAGRFVIFPNDRLEYRYSSMRNLPIIEVLRGTYSIKGNVLEFRVTEIDYRVHEAHVENNGIVGFDWADYSGDSNTITFKNPLILKFPVTEIVSKKIGDERDNYQKDAITIGGIDFYKMRDDTKD